MLAIAGGNTNEESASAPIYSLESEYRDYRRLSILVASGAAEHVMPKQRLPSYPVAEGAAKKAGVKYAAADGTELPNEGEQSVKFATREGHQCSILFQVADITQPLLSVAKLAAKGHAVSFQGDTGTIVEKTTGRSIKFHRQGGVYMLHVWVRPGPLTGVSKACAAEKASGFHRPGGRSP